ncbi:adenylate/guanylate cyclase domain-containing protein, partial [bacterium]|nr:adenylate/guanylate cyclase domain-containing protein [bacterium]
LLSRYGKTSFEECSSLNAAVLYSDIRGFTPLSEHHPPEVIVSTLNDYFTLMERVIKAFGGTIEKFVGDAIIAVFRHHDGLSHPAMRAVNSGLAMKKALEEFNFKRQNDGKFQIANGVGIHYGTMFLGIIGRTSGRSDLFAFGKAIQVASRLEGLSKFGRESGIIFSESVAEHIPEDFERITISRNGQFAFELKFPSKK